MSGNNKSNAQNTYDDPNVSPGMLSSSLIAYCVDKFEIIKDYNKNGLGPATYHMRIGHEVLTWNKGEKVEYILGPEKNKNKNIITSVELKPNSLTFVTTIEEFNLPKDIIARYNLKSKWVHQGLLLGTGPIVDPELQARLLIPVHNFSSHPVIMHYGDEFISVEFTKTTNPDDSFDLNSGEKSVYIDNKNWNFNFKKYRKRIGDKSVESSVLSQFQAYDKAIEFYKQSIADITESNNTSLKTLEQKNEEALRRYTRYNFIGLIGTIVGIAVLVLTTWMLIDSAYEKSDMAYNLVKQYDGNSVDFRSFALKTSYKDLQSNIEDIKKQFVTSKTLATRDHGIEKRLQALDDKIKALDEKIMVRKQLDSKKNNQ